MAVDGYEGPGTTAKRQRAGLRGDKPAVGGAPGTGRRPGWQAGEKGGDREEWPSAEATVAKGATRMGVCGVRQTTTRRGRGGGGPCRRGCSRGGRATGRAD